MTREPDIQFHETGLPNTDDYRMAFTLAYGRIEGTEKESPLREALSFNDIFKIRYLNPWKIMNGATPRPADDFMVAVLVKDCTDLNDVRIFSPAVQDHLCRLFFKRSLMGQYQIDILNAVGVPIAFKTKWESQRLLFESIKKTADHPLGLSLAVNLGQEEVISKRALAMSHAQASVLFPKARHILFHAALFNWAFSGPLTTSLDHQMDEAIETAFQVALSSQPRKKPPAAPGGPS